MRDTLRRERNDDGEWDLKHNEYEKIEKATKVNKIH